MQTRSATARWILVILCAGALWASSVAADTAPTTPISANSGKVVLAATDVDPLTAEPTFKPRLYARNVAWWPFASGPHYGDVDLRGASDFPDDVLLTHVGSFRIGQGLAIPAELTGSLSGLASGRHQYFLIQMRADSINSEWPQTLASMGAAVVGRTPENGAVVRADRAAFDRLSASPLLQFIEPYHPAYKIHPTVGRVAQATPEEAASPIFKLQVTLWPGEPAAPTADLLRQLGATVTRVVGLQEYGETIEIAAHAALIPEIAKLESVVLVTEFAPALMNGYYGALYMQSPNAGIGDYPYWKAGIDGDGQVVAAADSGLSVDAADHSDTAAVSGWSANGTGGGCAVLATYAGCNNPNNGADPTGPTNCHRKIVCYRYGVGVTADYSACDSQVSGAFTHGQVVAGVMAGNPTRGRVPAPSNPSPTDTVAADDPNSFRTRAYGPGQFIDEDRNGAFSEAQDTGLDGIAKGARIVMFDIDAGCPEDGTVLGPDVVNTIAQARTQHGASVINFSWGSAIADTNPVYAPYGRNNDLGVQSHPIMVVTQSAGNDGEAGNNGINASGSTLGDNATCKNCLVVGASFGIGSTFSFSSEGPAYFSSSPVNRSRVAPTILGEGLDNACRSEDAGTENQTGAATCQLQQAQGTSFSAPNIAGAAALIREYFDQGFYNNKPTKAISSRLVRALMFAGATPIVAGKTFIPPARFNNVWGYGQLQLTRILPLIDFPGTVTGLIVHDLPGVDLNGDGTTPDGVSDLSLPGTINGGQTLTSEFTVNGVTDDLAVALVWDDSLGAASETGILNDNLNLVLRYCGPNGTCGDGDDQTYKGNAFSEDPERDGTRNADLLVGGRAGSLPDGWWYTLPDSFITAGGGTLGQWVDVGNNSEAVYVATFQNRPDENLDGTADFPALCTNADPNCNGGTALTGKWRVEISAAAAVPSGRPFVVAIAGPVTAGSTVRFTDNPIVCNGESRIVVEEKAAAGGDADPGCVDASNCPASLISSRTIVEVLDGNGVVQDTETNLSFDTPPAGSLRFQTTKPVPVSVDPSASGSNGVLYVQNGWRVRVRYSDNNGSSTVVRESEAGVDCQPGLEVFLIRQVGRDTYFRLDGGCDDDRYLDAGEAFGLTFQFYNQEERELPDAEIELKVVDADACPANPDDPCRNACSQASFIRIDNPVQKIGLLPPLTLQNSTFSLSVVGTPPARKRVEFIIGIRSEKAGQGEKSCQSFRNIEAFQLLAQADDETRYFTTDCQTGCTLNFDRNNDERLENRIPPNPFDPFDFALRGKDETAIQYLSLTTPTRTSGCTNCAQNAAVGGPWDFDQNREGFRSGVSQTSKLQTTDTDGCSNWGEDKNWNDVLDSGENQGGGTTGLDQNWGTGGGCGFMTGTSATQGGVWHTGTIGNYNNNGGAACRPNDSICEQYDTNNGTLGQLFWAELLRTPSVHPISQGPDTVDGYEWKTQVLDWAWNMQINLGADGYSAWTWNFDLDTGNAEPILLGSEFIAFLWGNPYGVVTGGQLNILGGGHVFAPTVVQDGTANEGDGVNGTKGSNRAGVRGCWFNDLNLIDLDGSGPGVQTAAWRPTANPFPTDDDCDNDYNLGPNGCPGNCGVDDDGNGQIDDELEICPCFKCVTGSPNAGKPCINNTQCNTANTTNFACVSATSAAGVPTPYGDDICGDGSTDETLAATFGTNASLRQIRNFNIRRIASSARQTGNIAFNTLEDIYGPAGDTWAAEVGFIVYEASSTPFPVGSYGMAIDDMVIEWQETHPVAQVGNKCSTAGNPDFIGACATVSLGTFFVTDGDGAIPVTVIDPVPTDNLVNCDADPALELQVQAFSASERIPETFCLDPVGTAGIEFKGFVVTTSRAARANDKRVYIAYNAAITPTVTVRYFDKNDGKNVVSNGPDGQPGVAGFDDDGDGTVDDADELCPQTTTLAPGRSPHVPGAAVRYSDDTCGCLSNPIAAAVVAAFDFADIRLANVFIKDGGATGAGTGDGDGYADPNETIQVDVVLRNAANFPLENVKLTLQSDSPYIQDIRDNSITIARLEKNAGGLPGFFDTCDTRFGTNQNNEANGSRCPNSDHFVFTVVPPAGVSRASLAQELYSSFTLTIQALGKAEAGSDLSVDVPILGSAVAQGFRLAHNLDKPAVTTIADVIENFESFTTDVNVRNFFRPFNTGDNVSELDGNHCQINDPDNPNGNNTDPADFCQLGAGFNNAENHWHLHAPSAAGVCEDGTCPDGGRSANVLSASTGRKSLSSTNTLEGDTTPIVGDQMTEDYNRMTWVEWHRAGTASGPGNTFQLGFPDPNKTVTSPRLQAQWTGPELTYWTQLSIIDARLFGDGAQLPGDYAFSAARVYACIDHNDSGACDTKETGSLDGSEKWEPLRAWYSPESSYRINNFINCMYDPTDDGSTESQFFPNSVTTGPSSTCLPNAVDSCIGRTRNDDSNGLVPVVLGEACFPETGVEATDGVVGFAGGASWTQARWILKRYRLDDFAGRKVMFRWHMTPGELGGIENCASILTWGCGNRDDGWFIDDIRVNGLANPFTLSVDNAGEATAPPAPTICTPGEINPALSAIPYPTFDPNTNKTRPAAACSDSAVATCDFNGDATVDAASDTTTSDAALRPYQLTGITTPSATCVNGDIEYRFRDGLGATLNDWSAAPQTNSGSLIVTPAVSTDYFLDVRCSSNPGVCLQTDQIRINVPTGACALTATSLRLPARTTISWSGSGTFDTAKGDVAALRAANGNFGGASCLENNGADTTTPDAATPAAGASFYYLVRCDGGSWEDPAGTGQVGVRGNTLTVCP